MRLVLAAALLSILAGCANWASTAGGVSSVVVPPAELAQLQRTCAAAMPILAVATASNAPGTIRSIAVYGQEYCAQLASGTVPPTTDGNTPKWLASVLNAVQIAAQVAGAVMPFVSLF